ncbi:MAG: hypothetical protein A2219_01460 [Elusimicrobia bacterium RIFOXYA2_FULL_50_26]|nr:MAG: hypothetical protein A2219_01460 [Elusimicrobia bacterium RIFOXYA2_FULL_50_26]
MNILFEIAEKKRERLAQRIKDAPVETLMEKLSSAPACRGFKNAVSAAGRINIIAEVKQASPSAGIISADFNPAAQAARYQSAGVAAISVLTEEDYFKGSLDHLVAVRKRTSLPVLRKDFIIDTYQIYESRVYGADAILLIATLHEPGVLRKFLEIAETLGMDCLLEIHNEQELQKVSGLPFGILGINNRNLADFSVDLASSARLATMAGEGKTVVIESGIKTADDIAMFTSKGISAFLIGETLMRSQNVAATIKDMTGI